MQVVHDLEFRPLAFSSGSLLSGTRDGVHDRLLVGGQLEIIIKPRLRLVRHVKKDPVEHLVVAKLDVVILKLDGVVVSGDEMPGLEQVEHLVVEGRSLPKMEGCSSIMSALSTAAVFPMMGSFFPSFSALEKMSIIPPSMLSFAIAFRYAFSSLSGLRISVTLPVSPRVL